MKPQTVQITLPPKPELPPIVQPEVAANPVQIEASTASEKLRSIYANTLGALACGAVVEATIDNTALQAGIGAGLLATGIYAARKGIQAHRAKKRTLVDGPKVLLNNELKSQIKSGVTKAGSGLAGAITASNGAATQVEKVFAGDTNLADPDSAAMLGVFGGAQTAAKGSVDVLAAADVLLERKGRARHAQATLTDILKAKAMRNRQYSSKHNANPALRGGGDAIDKEQYAYRLTDKVQHDGRIYNPHVQFKGQKLGAALNRPATI